MSDLEKEYEEEDRSNKWSSSIFRVPFADVGRDKQLSAVLRIPKVLLVKSILEVSLKLSKTPKKLSSAACRENKRALSCLSSLDNS